MVHYYYELANSLSEIQMYTQLFVNRNTVKTLYEKKGVDFLSLV